MTVSSNVWHIYLLLPSAVGPNKSNFNWKYVPINLHKVTQPIPLLFYYCRVVSTFSRIQNTTEKINLKRLKKKQRSRQQMSKQMAVLSVLLLLIRVEMLGSDCTWRRCTYLVNREDDLSVRGSALSRPSLKCLLNVALYMTCHTLIAVTHRWTASYRAVRTTDPFGKKEKEGASFAHIYIWKRLSITRLERWLLLLHSNLIVSCTLAIYTRLSM